MGRGNPNSGVANNLSIGVGGKNFGTNTTGAYNIAIGATTLTALTNGTNNNAIGFNALKLNTTGGSNNAFGANALTANIAGSNNTAVGEGALSSNNGSAANNNTAVGWASLDANTTGDQNTAIGSQSDVGGAALFNATAIGFGAIVNASNTIQLGNTSVSSVVTSGTLSATGGAVLGTLRVTGGSPSAGKVLVSDASGNATWQTSSGITGVGTVTSVNPITVNASGSTFTSTVTNASTTPSIALTIPLASVAGTTAGLLSKTDYDAFSGKQGALTAGAGSGISISGGTISATGITTSNLSSTAGITNGQLANSSVILGSTAMSLGGTYTSVTGLSSVTSTSFTGTLSGTASGLTTARTISTTGDITSSGSFDGTSNLTLSTTLSNTGVVSNTYGSSAMIPKITVDSKGRVTSLEEVAVGSSAIGAPLNVNKIIVGNASNLAVDVNMTGDVGIVSTGATTVNSVGGVLSTTITTVASSVNSATESSTANTIVKRDGSGGFSAGAITATSANLTNLRVTGGTLSAGSVLVSDASGNATWGTNGLYALNGITSGTHSLTTGITGTDFNISSSGSTHTFNLPDASPTARGAVTTGTQTFAGNKTFSGTLSTTSLTVTSGLTAGAVAYPIAHGSNGQVLSTTGSGTLTWTTPSAGITGVGSIGSTANSSGATISGTSLILTPANATNGGVVTTGDQTFAGNKTYSGTLSTTSLTATGSISSTSVTTGTFTATTATVVSLRVTGSSPSLGKVLTSDANGNATWQAGGITAVGSISATSNSSGATVSGTSLVLTPADASNGGVLTSGTQTIGGEKRFDKAVTNLVAFNASNGTTINFANSNLAYTTAVPGAFTLTGIKDGGTYTLAVQGSGTGTSSFSATNFSFTSLGNYAATSGKHTLYTFVVMGSRVYFSMVSEQ